MYTHLMTSERLKKKKKTSTSSGIETGESSVLPGALRCPETLFISHEHANFLFSGFRVVQGEAKTPKIMGYCRAFLHFYMP